MGLITKNDIYLNLEVNTQKETLYELARIAFEHGKVDDIDTFYEQLCLREEESTTGFGRGIAIPHARHKCVKEGGVIVARLDHGVEWKSMDESLVEVCICLIAPDDENDLHLKMLSKLARKLIYNDFTDMLKNADESTIFSEINRVLE
ncbi:fructose PTS transporter subunit IIA [Cytobacillus sp. Hz8]|uniref:fructose PTS transporter subunit IIA n=1 Tax=Cytobacillus sp. Hz8 TaxID=3347168 RepID=UPI0035D7715F